MTVDLKEIVKLQMAEIDRLRGEVARLQAEIGNLVIWAQSDVDRDALSTLQGVYLDPRASEGNRLKAASAALPYERAKPASSSVVVQVDFREKVRSIRLRQLELDKARWAAEDAAKIIEHQPGTALDGSIGGASLSQEEGCATSDGGAEDLGPDSAA
jgi:hypothetical protein